MDVQVETPTPDAAFDAAVVAESTSAAPAAVSVDADLTRDEQGRFAAEAEDTPADVVAAPVDEKKPGKPRNDFQARIDQLTAKQREAERRAEDAERRARELEARHAPKEPPAAQPAVEKFPDYATYLQQHPDASMEVWMDARDEWRDSRREAQIKEQQETTHLEQTFSAKASGFSEKYKAATTADPTLVDRLDPALLGVRPFSLLTKQDKAAIRAIPNPVERDAVAFRCFLADHWLESEHPVALLEHLSDPAEFQRLASLPPTAVSRELAKLDVGFGAAPPKESSGSAPKPVASHARPPFKPLGTTPHTAPADDGTDDEPLDKFIARENARDRKAGRL
jgi:exonuclease VII large subunit